MSLEKTTQIGPNQQDTSQRDVMGRLPCYLNKSQNSQYRIFADLSIRTVNSLSKMNVISTPKTRTRHARCVGDV